MATGGRIRGLVLSLGCIAGCAGYPPQEPITDARLEELRSRLEGNSPRERVAAAAELARTHDRGAIGVLIDAVDLKEWQR
jgi:hypothetical protein